MICWFDFSISKYRPFLFTYCRKWKTMKMPEARGPCACATQGPRHQLAKGFIWQVQTAILGKALQAVIHVCNFGKYTSSIRSHASCLSWNSVKSNVRKWYITALPYVVEENCFLIIWQNILYTINHICGTIYYI